MNRNVAANPIEIGRIVGIHGLQGWLKVHSYTEPRERLFEYRPLSIGGSVFEEFEGKSHGKGLLLRLVGIDDRTAAEPFVGKTIEIERSRLPELPAGEFYHADLLGLRVVTEGGDELGTVTSVAATGANDVLIVSGDRERLIPFTIGHTVTQVDLEAGRIIVDWEADWL